MNESSSPSTNLSKNNIAKIEYVEKYYSDYANGKIDDEIRKVGSFLSEHVNGKTLDCGCGPVPQLWAIFMNQMTELSAVDLPQESIDFVHNKLTTKEWYSEFESYKRLLETWTGILPKNYIEQQVGKIKTVLQADMSQGLPFDDSYFDTAMSLYSLGCLENEVKLTEAIEHMKRVLKSGGIFIHINTDGKNSNDILPAYTWSGLSQDSLLIQSKLEDAGFEQIMVTKIPLEKDTYGMYQYGSITLLTAIKK